MTLCWRHGHDVGTLGLLSWPWLSTFAGFMWLCLWVSTYSNNWQLALSFSSGRRTPLVEFSHRHCLRLAFGAACGAICCVTADGGAPAAGSAGGIASAGVKSWSAPRSSKQPVVGAPGACATNVSSATVGCSGPHPCVTGGSDAPPNTCSNISSSWSSGNGSPTVSVSLARLEANDSDINAGEPAGHGTPKTQLSEGAACMSV